MNGKRRLAFFTACNIDGIQAKSVDRDTKIVRPLRPDSPGLERLDQIDAEAESWSGDCRIEAVEYAGEQFYERQKVPGFPNPNAKGRIARMFQKGHLIRRLDPCWGNDDMALAAEEDTFHWTNCAPQVGFFNQGTADPGIIGTGRGALWRAVENYVLRNAVAMKQRITSFSGPIFDPDDRPYRGLKVPSRFFKVTVWAEDDELRSLAMIADQGKVIQVWPEALFTGAAESLSEAEAFMDEGELDKVQDFLSTIQDVEALTKLDFGAAVRNADVRAGEGPEKVTAKTRVDLLPKRRSKGIRR
jgi:endonuclease G